MSVTEKIRFLACATLVIAACGDDSGAAADAAPDAIDPREIVLAPWDHACDDPIDSVYESATPPTPWTAELRGTIVRCAYERMVTTDEMAADITSYGHVDPGLTTDVHKVRISYWTERFDGQPVLTSGVMYIPDAMRGDPAPLVVIGHGSVGVADICAPSAEHADGFEKDWKSLVYMLAGDGWLTVMPDFPGLGTEGVAAWNFSLDEGHALLDATRAVRALGPDVVGDRNALVGHSLGGHAALSADSYYADYGAAGTIEGVLLFSPLWVSNAAWPALISDGGTTLISPVFMALSLMYHYGHFATYDGESHATDGLLPDKADDIVQLLESACWQNVTNEVTGPPSIGLDVGRDAYTAEFVDTVGACGFNPSFCNSEAAQLWRERWIADRPPPDTSIPIVHWIGELDDFITPGFQECGIDRLEAQGATITVCVDKQGSHSDLLTQNAAWTNQHLAAILLDETPPDPCPGEEVLDEPLMCNLPIANGLTPDTP